MYLFEQLDKPTRLYIKQCPETGLKYFGKYTKEDIEDYPGSGVRWTKHLKNRKIKPIHLWNSDWYYDTSITRFALLFSLLNKIVESREWANQKPENGLDGGRPPDDKFNMLIDNPSKRLAKEGKHHFQTNNPSKEKVKDGTHHLLGGEVQKKACVEGRHIFGTENHPAKIQVKNGTHHFQTNNPSKNKYKCNECDHVNNKGNMSKHQRKTGHNGYTDINKCHR